MERIIAFVEDVPSDRHGLGAVIDLQRAAPQTQTLPICRATSAACELTPPRAVRMPSAAIMPRRSSGEVSLRTSKTFSPFCAAADRAVGVEINLAGGRARAGGKTGRRSLWRSCTALRSKTGAST